MWVTYFIILLLTKKSYQTKNCCIYEIVNLLDRDSLVVISDGSQSSADLLTELSKMNLPKIIYNLLECKEDSAAFAAKSYIFVIEDVDTLQESWMTKSLNLRGKFLFIFPSAVTETNASKIFTEMWRKGVFNAVIWSQVTDQVYTWYPYSAESNCGKKVVVKKFNISENLYKESPFEGKTAHNLNGCALRVMWSFHKVSSRDPNDPTHPG